MIGAEIFDGRTKLTFFDPIGSGRVVDYLSVRIEEPDMSARRQVYGGWADGFVSLARYFDSLVESWRGWDGERVYESIEHDQRLAAVHDGHVRIAILLAESTDPWGWQVRAMVKIEAGEQLSAAARDVSELVRVNPSAASPA